jgi:hypothetical protein
MSASVDPERPVADEPRTQGPPGEEILAEESVRRWLAELGLDDPRRVAERDAYASSLARFCAATGSRPDELVASCLRETGSGDLAISARGRRAMDARIDAYVEAEGLVGRDAIVAGNRLRSFLIHNGVYLQGRVAWP